MTTINVESVIFHTPKVEIDGMIRIEGKSYSFTIRTDNTNEIELDEIKLNDVNIYSKSNDESYYQTIKEIIRDDYNAV